MSNAPQVDAANYLLSGVEITDSIQDMIDVMVRKTVRELNEDIMVVTTASGFSTAGYGMYFGEDSPDFLDVAAAVNREYEPWQQIAWLLEHRVPEIDIQWMLKDAYELADRAREFIAHPLKGINLPEDAIETREWAASILLEEFISVWLKEYASDYVDARLMPKRPQTDLNIVGEHVEKRALEIKSRGFQAQVEWAFQNGFSEHDLVVCFSGTPEGQQPERQQLTIEDVKSHCIQETPEL